MPEHLTLPVRFFASLYKTSPKLLGNPLHFCGLHHPATHPLQDPGYLL